MRPRGRLRHRRLRRRAHAGPAVQPGEAARAHGDRPHRGDPRHLRPERPQPGGQGPGRAGPAALPPARACGARARSCPSRAAACRPAAPASARGPGRDPARGRPPAHPAPHHKLEGDLRGDRPAPPDPAQGRAPQPPRPTSPSSATPTPASRRCSTSSPTPACSSRTGCSPPSTPPPAASTCPAASRVLPSATPSGSSASCPTAWSRRSSRRMAVAADADLLVHLVDASRGRHRRPDAGGADGARRDRRRRRARAAGVQQGRPRPGAARARWSSAHPGVGGPVGPHRRGRRRCCCAPSATGCGRLTEVVELLIPYDRGDLLAAVHRAGRGAERVPPRRRRAGPGPASTTPARRGSPNWAPAH